jgi:hypothetical protein
MTGRVGEPGVRFRTIGAVAVPLFAALAPVSSYVPEFTHATLPALNVAAALPTVRHGAACVPEFELLPAGST